MGAYRELIEYQGMADLKDDEMLLAVKVPANGTPGMALNVSAPDGRVFEVVVPPNTPPGSTINVLVKKAPPTYEESGLPVATAVPGMESAPTVKEGGPSETEGAAPGPREKIDSRSTAAAAGAAGAGAIAGAVVLGGLTGTLVAATLVGGAAMYATTQDGKVGDVVRTAGAKTADAAGAAYDYAKEHKVVDKAKAAATATAVKAKEINDEYDLTGKAKAGASAVAHKAAEVNEKYDITGKVASATSSMATKAAELDKEHNITGKAATAAVSAGMGAMSLFGKAKDAMNKATAEQQTKK